MGMCSVSSVDRDAVLKHVLKAVSYSCTPPGELYLEH